MAKKSIISSYVKNITIFDNYISLTAVWIRMVEAGGVEPPSGKPTTKVSPGADRSLKFAADPSTDELALGYLDNLSTNLRELIDERPGLFDARPGLPG